MLMAADGGRRGPPAWAAWVPRPAAGLPIYAALLALAAAMIVVLGLPQPLLTLLAVPIPLVAIRWPRAASYAAIGTLGAAACVVSVLRAPDVAATLQRVLIQLGALAAMTEVVTWASATVAANEAKYRLLVETSTVIPWERDLTTWRFTYVGPRAESVLGYPLEQWYAEGFWADHLHPDDRDETIRGYRRAAEGREDHEFEYRMLASDGRVVWVRDLFTVGDGPRGPRGLRGVMIDVTERRRAEEEQRRLEGRVFESQKLESLGLLAGGIAHDFNNLLTAILGNASLALGQLPAHHPARGPIDDVQSAAERAAELTRQMLAYAGRAPFTMRVADLSTSVREMARLLSSVVSKRARLDLDLSPRPLWVQVDVAQLHQVVMNLVTNASDAVGERGGTIRIRTDVMQAGTEYLAHSAAGGDLQSGLYAYVEVSDDGPGMDEAVARRMFDPFFTTKSHGRGLGLAAVLGITRRLGGAMRVESAPGSGTGVRMLLPMTEAPRDAAVSASGTASSRRSHATVLVVDDEPAVRRLARNVLAHHGFEVREAESGEQALDILRGDDRFTALVLDLTMPGLSGLETLARLRAFRPHLPVLLMSGYAEEELAGRWANTGTAAFLRKPFRATELADRLRTLVGP
jgi:PAS domain S-box-containing protein